MALRLVHRILITAGIVLGVIMMAFTAYRWVGRDDPSFLFTGVLGALCAVGLSLYLRWFLRKSPLKPRA
jgi:asparagine N-glycosylation enzyme membrane subunit Stt3